MSRLLELFCEQTGANADNVISHARHRKVALERHTLMWILRRNVKDQLYNRAKSHPEIGRFMGRRDHSSVIHGINRIENDSGLRKKAKLIERDVLLAEFDKYSG
jgi:chromosomal replication initiator protein